MLQDCAYANTKHCFQVPIRRMPAVRPAPAHQLPTSQQQHTQQPRQQPAVQPGLYQTPSTTKPQPAQPQRARKRAKQAAGASTVLLALFSFVVLMGPLGPLQGLTPSLPQQPPQQDAMHSSGAGVVTDGLHSSGRVLMSLPSAAEHMPAGPNDTRLQLLHESRLPKNGVMSLVEGSGENNVALPGHQRHADMRLQGQGWWSQGPDDAPCDSPKSIMLRPCDKAAEQEALEGLKASALLTAKFYLQFAACIHCHCHRKMMWLFIRTKSTLFFLVLQLVALGHKLLYLCCLCQQQVQPQL